ncbi:MAG: citramalate synthase [Desulfovibrio sp.]|nr:MAG: citramalate synthase [Desulfovibrio sp.]
MKRIAIYDTTLRDGTQAEDINLSTQDKIKIARKLDDLGVKYIEGGWPASNPTDQAFFQEIANYALESALICAFGSTHHPKHKPESDPNLRALMETGAPVATIFGKTWDLHVKDALRVEPERNLELIHDSVAFLKTHFKEVIFDAEHFFDGFKANPDYAIATLAQAFQAKANVLVLCDTNGGALPHEVRAAVRAVKKALPKAKLGIHAHNDSELAVANTLAAVRCGAVHVQGTMNGYGERCGNANLCSIIPNLELKFEDKYRCLPAHKLELMTMVSAYISEVANARMFNRQPFVGRSAFAHKGGIHVSAVNRNAVLYEHIDPSLVGNKQRVLLSELAGRSNIVNLAKRHGFHMDKDEPVVKGLLAELKKKAALGYDYAAAEASVELLLLRKLARRGVRDFFTLIKSHVMDSKESPDDEPRSEATVMVEVEGVEAHTAALGHGPVNALDNALRKALRPFYPRLDEMKLMDFKVRVLSGTQVRPGGTASTVRVLIESADKDSTWVTVGVSFNIIEASWQALIDSVTYKLYKDEFQKRIVSQSDVD